MITGTFADTSKDNKDASTNKESKETTKAGAETTESGADRGTLKNINTSVSAQNNDVTDLLKGEDISGKQSPTPRIAKKWGKK